MAQSHSHINSNPVSTESGEGHLHLRTNELDEVQLLVNDYGGGIRLFGEE